MFKFINVAELEPVEPKLFEIWSRSWSWSRNYLLNKYRQLRGCQDEEKHPLRLYFFMVLLLQYRTVLSCNIWLELGLEPVPENGQMRSQSRKKIILAPRHSIHIFDYLVSLTHLSSFSPSSCQFFCEIHCDPPHRRDCPDLGGRESGSWPRLNKQKAKKKKN